MAIATVRAEELRGQKLIHVARTRALTSVTFPNTIIRVKYVG